MEGKGNVRRAVSTIVVANDTGAILILCQCLWFANNQIHRQEYNNDEVFIFKNFNRILVNFNDDPLNLNPQILLCCIFHVDVFQLIILCA